MKSSSLYRLGAIAGVLNAVLLVVSDTLPAGILAGTLNLLAGLFHSLALPAMYLRQRRESGLLGAVGYIVNAVGLILILGVVFSSVFVVEPLGDAIGDQRISGLQAIPYSVSTVLFVLGSLLFAVATFRAGVFHRAAAVLYGTGFCLTLFVTAMPGFVLTLAAIVAGAGMLWFAHKLWSTI